MITAIGNVMRRAYEKGWITTRDGNVSLRRRNSNIMYITPSGWRKTIIHPEHMIKVRILQNGYKVPANTTPSGELEMHYLIQKNNKKTQAVVHLHPTNTIAAMYAGWDLQSISAEFPEVSRYTKVGPIVPVLPVTSDVLATATLAAITDFDSGKVIYDIVGQKNHGVCAVGSDPWAAFEHVERLEHICEIVLKSGKKIK
jgi:ribulose-5-phosphate 4-epimerase/fuculose-1-phosphate aldolase